MWYKELWKEDSGYQLQDGIWISEKMRMDKNLESYKNIGGTDFFSRTKIPGTHSYFDTQVLYHHLDVIFKDKSPDVLLDLGCGDGRAVEWFLKNTTAKIIAVDGTLDSLKRLRVNYVDQNPGNAQRILIIHANILDVPLRNDSIDALYTFEAMCFLLNQYESGIRECRRLLRPGGMLVNADRTKEYGMLYELMNRGPQGFLEAFEKDQLFEVCLNEGLHSSIFTDEQVERILAENGFGLQYKKGIPFFSILISFLKGQGLFLEDIEKQAEKMAKALIQYSDSYKLIRTSMFISTKY